MERLTHILDTNVVADYINQTTPTTQRIEQAIRDKHTVYLAQPVYYEVMRGLLHINATRKLKIFQDQFMPQLAWLPLMDEDWHQAAVFWANTRKAGKQLSDTDLLIAAVTMRLNGVLVSADDDFNALPIKWENWREPSQ